MGHEDVWMGIEIAECTLSGGEAIHGSRTVCCLSLKLCGQRLIEGGVRDDLSVSRIEPR